jgi:hypothetical protein
MTSEAYPLPITNRRGEVVAYSLIDEQDAERAGALRWHLSHGYPVASLGRRDCRIYLHRLIIGEIEERYCEIAAQRMGQEVFDLGEAA